MFGSLRNFPSIRRSLFGLYTPKPTLFLMLCSYGSMKKLFVYVHCCGLYLGVFMWENILGRVVVLLCKVDGVLLGVARHNFVNLTM